MRTHDDIRDEWLVLRCQSGDTAALTDWSIAGTRVYCGTRQRLTGLPDAADDVVQSVWVAILRGLRQLDDPACFRRWPYQIATYKCADWVRERQSDRVSSIPLADELIEEKSTDKHSQEDLAVLSHALKQLHRSIKRSYRCFISTICLLPKLLNRFRCRWEPSNRVCTMQD